LDPQDIKTIDEIGEAVEAVIASEDYPAARELLYGLMSELRVRTSNLPLATYPAALAEAARLLDQKKSDEARIVLMMALGTLLDIDQVTPLPLLVAREANNQAEAQRDKDKEIALALLDTVPLENPERSEPEGIILLSEFSLDAHFPARTSHHTAFDPSFAPRPPTPDPRPAPSNRGPRTFGS
jgi:hypothetical protein